MNVFAAWRMTDKVSAAQLKYFASGEALATTNLRGAPATMAHSTSLISARPALSNRTMSVPTPVKLLRPSFSRPIVRLTRIGEHLCYAPTGAEKCRWARDGIKSPMSSNERRSHYWRAAAGRCSRSRTSWHLSLDAAQCDAPFFKRGFQSAGSTVRASRFHHPQVSATTRIDGQAVSPMRPPAGRRSSRCR